MWLIPTRMRRIRIAAVSAPWIDVSRGSIGVTSAHIIVASAYLASALVLNCSVKEHCDVVRPARFVHRSRSVHASLRVAKASRRTRLSDRWEARSA